MRYCLTGFAVFSLVTLQLAGGVKQARDRSRLKRLPRARAAEQQNGASRRDSPRHHDEFSSNQVRLCPRYLKCWHSHVAHVIYLILLKVA